MPLPQVLEAGYCHSQTAWSQPGSTSLLGPATIPGASDATYPEDSLGEWQPGGFSVRFQWQHHATC